MTASETLLVRVEELATLRASLAEEFATRSWRVLDQAQTSNGHIGRFDLETTSIQRAFSPVPL